MDAVELHPWAATVEDIERPDRLVFDLDPGPGIEWALVVEAALELRKLLEDEGHANWPKLTGGKGLHVMVPVVPRLRHDQARLYCKKLAQKLEQTAPERFTLASAPEARGGRIYIDYLRNGRRTTAIGAYSPRARQGFPVAAPGPGRRSRPGRRQTRTRCSDRRVGARRLRPGSPGIT
jgi:bifunctional non-homologous end joining protein LigD